MRKGGDWRVDFVDGERTITGSGRQAAGYMGTLGGNFIHEQLDLAQGECVYALGGRFTPFVKNGQVVESGHRLHEQHGYMNMSLPLMARPNSVIPAGSNDQRPDYDYADGVCLHVFELEDGAVHRVSIPTVQGENALEATVTRRGQSISIRVEGASKPWSVLLRGVGKVNRVEGGAARQDDLGTLLTPEQGGYIVAEL